jgi:hypothetical protein
MPSRVSIIRRRRAFDEGRRSASEANAQNPYDNAALKKLWETGRKAQASGQLTTPVPTLPLGERRAARVQPGQQQRRARIQPRQSGNGNMAERQPSFGKYRKPGATRRYR